MLRTQIYNADEGTLDTLGDPALAEGRNFTREEAERDTLRLRALPQHEREVGADGLPREKFLQDVVISRAYGKLAFGDRSRCWASCWRTRTATCTASSASSTASTTPTAGPSTSTPSSTRAIARAYEFGAPFLVRAEPGQAAALAKALEDAAAGSRTTAATSRVRTMDEVKAAVLRAAAHAVSTLMSVVVVLLVLVTSLGIVGLTSFSVTERTRQIGTRRALGARRGDVLVHFLAENWLAHHHGRSRWAWAWPSR